MAMLRLKPIRRARRRGIPRDVRRVADAAFCIVLALAVGLTVERVASGLPELAALFVTDDTMSAQAGVPPKAADTPISLRKSDDVALQQVRDSSEAALAGPPRIAIVIDDLGADVAHTRQAIALPQVVGLAFLPYPESTPTLAVPMQAIGGQNPGPMALSPSLSPEENNRRLDWGLARVPGFVGINNHEGSLFTSNRDALVPVIEHLADRHVFFFDSRTTADSQVVSVARAFGVASAARDVFLDDVQTIDAVDAELRMLEARARDTGVAIAIGHLHEITLDAVAYWTAHHDGFELVPLSEAIRLKTEREARQSLALAGG
jgi:polysaccharide deacetylase 2 family uncharacterized protein YibQ